MTITATIDVETFRNARSEEYFSTKTYEAPGNYKDPDKIAAAIEEKRKSDMAGAALSWWTAQIVAICSIPLSSSIPAFSSSGLDERELLVKFFTWLSVDSFNLVGKSSADFDLPMLAARAMVHNIGLPECVRLAHQPCNDIDQYFGFSRQGGQRSNLANYAWGIGMQKSGHGGQVEEMVKSGEWDKLESYCLQDNQIVAELYRRYNKPFRSEEQ